MMKKILNLCFPFFVAFVASASPSLAAGTRPTVTVTVANGTNSVTITAGTSVTITGRATDPDGDLREHWLEIQNPSGQWSWQGWLTGEPWAGAIVGNGATAQKSGTYNFPSVGTYYVRSTAIDNVAWATQSWSISNIVQVVVKAQSTPTPTPSPTPSPTPTPRPTPTPTPRPTPTPTPVPPAPAPAPSPAPSVDTTIFNSNGTVNQQAYVNYLANWTSSAVSQHLGPTFAQLNPGATEDRPLNYQPPSRSCSLSYANKINPYELGPSGGCYTDTDYWSEAGQVAYVPDNAASDPGLDRVQVFAYYDNVFALSPRLDWASGTPHPDPQTQETSYRTLLGFPPSEPVAMARSYGMNDNEALVVYRDGLFALAGTQTSRNSYDRPLPGFVFPSNKVPTGIAITTNNEFALVTIWDTTALKGQLAVVALEAKYIPFHTWPYMALPNQGSWSDFKLLGYIDLPMAAPSAVAAASNGWWSGPSQTNGETLGQINLTLASTLSLFTGTNTQWNGVIATKGYAIVSSKLDNKAAILDLTPLFNYVRTSYLSSATSFAQTVANRGSGPGKWPATFTERPDIKPTIAWQASMTKPTAVLAGLTLDRWSQDRFKAYVATEDGTIHILDTSPLMARFSWNKVGTLGEMGTVRVGRNPIGMAFARHGEAALPLIPSNSSPDALNNQFYVACRGDREVDAVVTFGGQGQVYRKIKDQRMGDPVAVSVAYRGNILSVADYAGKKLLSFRIGKIVDRQNRVYGCGADGTAKFEFAGQINFSGNPIAINTANVN